MLLNLLCGLGMLVSLNAFAVESLELKTGDLILESLPCHLCSMIEAEEDSSYSHVGLVVNQPGQVSVMEAYEKVQVVSLEEFLKKRKPDSQVLVIRALKADGTDVDFEPYSVLEKFYSGFQLLSYDAEFSWTNEDSNGEKLYCSEFVAKFLNAFLPIKLQPKPMHFEKNREFWIHYFKGTPPDGEPGISPGDFERSPLFRKVGLI